VLRRFAALGLDERRDWTLTEVLGAYAAAAAAPPAAAGPAPGESAEQR